MPVKFKCDIAVASDDWNDAWRSHDPIFTRDLEAGRTEAAWKRLSDVAEKLCLETEKAHAAEVDGDSQHFGDINDGPASRRLRSYMAVPTQE